MEWIETSVTTTSLGAERVSDCLIGAGAKGTQILDRADIDAFSNQPGFGEIFGEELYDALPEEAQVKAWFSEKEAADMAACLIEALKTSDEPGLGSLCFSYSSVKDEDWAENWKQYYKPLRVGQRLVIKPGWESYQPKEGDLIIDMDPGMAFGTGTHETTRLCLMLLEKHQQENDRVLDVGTGSGILAIASALLGAKAVTAIDLDPVAVKAAEENVKRNDLKSRVKVLQGDLAKDISGQFDLVSANIIADIILLLLPQLQGLLAQHARLVLSGIIKDREQDVRDGLAARGFVVKDALYEGEWVALLAIPGGQA